MAIARQLEPYEHFISGTTAGLVATVALFPLDTIKVRYQVDERTTLRSPQVEFVMSNFSLFSF